VCQKLKKNAPRGTIHRFKPTCLEIQR
jgi:hypothetical protein